MAALAAPPLGDRTLTRARSRGRLGNRPGADQPNQAEPGWEPVYFSRFLGIFLAFGAFL